MDVRLPNLGEGTDSGTVVGILVKEGDELRGGQTIVEVETGKAVVGVPTSVPGRVTSIRVQAGDKVTPGQVILTVEGAGGGASAAATKAASLAPAKPAAKARRIEPEPEIEEEVEAPGDGASEEDGTASQAAFPPPAAPSLRRIARDLGIDLRKVRGSEHGGRIVLDDVRAYIQRLQKLAALATQKRDGNKVAAPAPSVDFSKWGPIAKRPMTPLRKIIAQRMVESTTTIPQVTQFDDADISGLMALRKKHKAAYDAKGANLTVTVFVLKALADTLKKHPVFNASLDEVAEEIVFKEYFHIGIAVDTEAGLIVPVIRDVDKKSMLQLAKELGELAVKTRDRKVGAEELVGGSFTISNQGGIGGAHFTPIVNKPEVAILGLGRSAVKPVVKNGKIETATMMPITISYDHRVIDGGAAARFTTDLVNALQNFEESSLKL